MLPTYNQKAALKSTIFALCQHFFGALYIFIFIQFWTARFVLISFEQFLNFRPEVGTAAPTPYLPSPIF